MHLLTNLFEWKDLLYLQYKSPKSFYLTYNVNLEINTPIDKIIWAKRPTGYDPGLPSSPLFSQDLHVVKIFSSHFASLKCREREYKLCLQGI